MAIQLCSDVLLFVRLSDERCLVSLPIQGASLTNMLLILLTENWPQNHGSSWNGSNLAETLSCCGGSHSTLATDMHCLLCRHEGLPEQ